MTEYLDNPAGRIVAILQAARVVVGNSPNAFEGWARTFSIDINSKKGEAEVFHRMLEVDRLIDDLEKEVQSIEDEEEREDFLRPIPRLRAITPISQARSLPFPDLINPISEGDMTVLGFCSRHLHRLRAEARADEAELETLGKEVDDLFNEVSSSTTLDPELRTFLLTQIESIRRGIQDYRIGGLARLRETLGDVLGATLVNRDMVDQHKQNDEIKKFIQVTDKLISIIEFSSKSIKLIGTVSAILPHLLAAAK
jgi:hypothetical protein